MDSLKTYNEYISWFNGTRRNAKRAAHEEQDESGKEKRQQKPKTTQTIKSKKQYIKGRRKPSRKSRKNSTKSAETIKNQKSAETSTDPKSGFIKLERSAPSNPIAVLRNNMGGKTQHKMKFISRVLYAVLLIGIDICILLTIILQFVMEGIINQYSVVYLLVSLLVLFVSIFPVDDYVGSFAYWSVMFLGSSYILYYLRHLVLELWSELPDGFIIGTVAMGLLLADQTIFFNKYLIDGDYMSSMISLMGSSYLMSSLVLKALSYMQSVGTDEATVWVILAAGVLIFLWAVWTGGEMCEDRFKRGYTFDKLWEKIKYK